MSESGLSSGPLLVPSVSCPPSSLHPVQCNVPLALNHCEATSLPRLTGIYRDRGGRCAKALKREE